MASGKNTQVLGLKLSKKGGELIQKLTASNELLELLEVESSQEEFERRAMSVRPGLMVIEYRPNISALVDLLERLRVALPGCPVVALAKSKEPDEIIQAMRLGVREYLVIGPELLGTFAEAVLRLKQPTTADEPTGRIIGLMGAKGGVGTSSMAANLAWGLSQVHAQRVALVDLDLYGGNQAFLLDLDPERDFSPTWPGSSTAWTRCCWTASWWRWLRACACWARPKIPARPRWSPEHVLTVLDELAKTHAYVHLRHGRRPGGIHSGGHGPLRANPAGFGAHLGGDQGRLAHLHL
jgi:pilus assembly protein CpaE